MNSRHAWITLVALTAVIAAVLGTLRLTNHPQHQTASATQRVVLISHTMPAPSMPGQPLHVKLVSDTVFHDQAGVVLTDDECQPDANGISRCLNTIRLASGQTIIVRHPHDMHTVACLSPGERITIRTAG